MISTITCLHCGKKVPRNPRLKQGQRYCSSKECQRARIKEWKRQQYSTNESYRQKCLYSQKVWREKYPADKYQKQYREKHPEYVNRCRELQRKRNEKRREAEREGIDQKIVNRNTLSCYPRGDGFYALIPVKGGKIVNRNALMVRMQVLSG